MGKLKQKLEEYKKEAKELEILKEKGLKEFFVKYKTEVIKTNKAIEILKGVFNWLEENKDRRNFFLSDNRLGTKAKAEYENKLKEAGKLGIKWVNYIKTETSLTIKFSTAITYLSPTRFDLNRKTNFNYEVQIYKYNEGETQIYKLESLTFKQARGLVSKISKIDSKIEELKKQRSDLYYSNSGVLGQVFNISNQTR